MGDVKIIITKGNRVEKTLTYDVGEDVNADPGDQVKWVVETGSGVAAITAITQYKSSAEHPSSMDLFAGPGGIEPHPTNPQKTEWEGTLSTSDKLLDVEWYSITWTSVGGGWHNQDVGGIVTDPKIQISPKQST
jgi:hypothetical protein